MNGIGLALTGMKLPRVFWPQAKVDGNKPIWVFGTIDRISDSRLIVQNSWVKKKRGTDDAFPQLEQC
jgi:hypothetical protein